MITLDYSGTYLKVNPVQTVLYYVKSGEGTYDPSGQSVDYAFWTALTQDRIQVGPVTQKRNRRNVNLWATPLDGIVPKIGDKLTDAAEVTWIVDEVDLCDLDSSGAPQRYRCHCTQTV